MGITTTRPKKYQKAYQTMFLKEIKALADVGIKYHYVSIDDFGVRTYFFPKSPELFKVLMELHDDINKNGY